LRRAFSAYTAFGTRQLSSGKRDSSEIHHWPGHTSGICLVLSGDAANQLGANDYVCAAKIGNFRGWVFVSNDGESIAV